MATGGGATDDEGADRGGGAAADSDGAAPMEIDGARQAAARARASNSWHAGYCTDDT